MNAKDVTRLLPNLVAKISENYPEVHGASPSVEEKQLSVSAEAMKKLNISSVPSQKQFIVTFRKEITTEDGTPLQKVVRATLDEQGEVIRVTESKTVSPNDRVDKE